jgi:hypothetical protein
MISLLSEEVEMKTKVTRYVLVCNGRYAANTKAYKTRAEANKARKWYEGRYRGLVFHVSQRTA